MRQTTSRQLLAGMFLLMAVLLTACPPTKPAERRSSVGVQAGEQAKSSGKHKEEDILAEINGEVLKRGEFDRRLKALPEYARARYRTTERKQAWLNSLVQFELLADVAERRGLGGRPEVLDAMKQVVAEHTLREAIRQQLSAEDISEEAVEEAYREHIDRYRRPERRRAAVIITAGRDWATELRDKLVGAEYEDAQARINEFRKVAADVSLAREGDKNGGDFGWVKPPDHEPENTVLSEAIFGLEERGDVAGPLQIDGQWWLATWYDRQPPREQSLGRVSREVRQRLYEKRRARLEERLLERWGEQADVQVNEEQLEALEAPEPRRLAHPDQITIKSTHDID